MSFQNTESLFTPKRKNIMSFSSPLRNRQCSAPAARSCTQTSPRLRAGFRPLLEALEGRTLLSGLPYPAAATVSELVADIDYANRTGGAFTINLAPGTTFALESVNNTAHGPSGLPVIGGTRAVDLTIIGNGGTIERVGSAAFRLLSVAQGASLTLDDVTLQGGQLYSGGLGGAIANQGTLTVSDSTLSRNSVDGPNSRGGGIYNGGGTVTVSGSTLSSNSATGAYGGAIYNDSGTVTVSNSRLSGNWVSNGYSWPGGSGGGIYNAAGTVTVQNSSSIAGNYSYVGSEGNSLFDVYNGDVVYQDNTSTIGTLYGNPAIVHDPNAPQLWIGDVTVAEGHTGTTSATFTVTLTGASAQTVSVAYSTGTGTATAGSDYQAASGTLTFAPGEASKTITVPVYGDRVGEPNETFNVNLSGATNATIGDGQGIGTIFDDEPRISIDDVTRTEGSNGTTYFTFTVTLSAAYDQTVKTSFRTSDGTATTSNGDYAGKSGTLRFKRGERTKTISVAVKGDSTPEANEDFTVQLFGASSNVLLLDAVGIGTILNDD